MFPKSNVTSMHLLSNFIQKCHYILHLQVNKSAVLKYIFYILVPNKAETNEQTHTINAVRSTQTIEICK